MENGGGARDGALIRSGGGQLTSKSTHCGPSNTQANNGEGTTVHSVNDTSGSHRIDLDHLETRAPSNPLDVTLPAYLTGDAFKAWVFSLRFSEILQLEQNFSFQELEHEVMNPSFCGGVVREMHVSLLNMLVEELLIRVAEESNSIRGRNAEISATIKKMMRNMLPINDLTWPEVARRYMSAVLTMDFTFDSSVRSKVFQCLLGDGCGSRTGFAALEDDAMFLAEATKRIFDSLKGESDGVGSSNIPDWALPLEPVRKLPTNTGSHTRHCIHKALAKNPPIWARRALEHSISKQVYKSNAAGPTKRAVISILDDLEKPKHLLNTLSDLRMRECRIILRRVVTEDEDKIFCNFMGRSIDNDDDSLMGYPTTVSRPLSFRSIDLRLGAGAYGGSHQAFFEDVQEVWSNIRSIYRGQPDMIELAESFATRFVQLYSKEVLTIAQQILECTNPNTPSTVAEQKRNDLLDYKSESLIPKSPWEEPSLVSQSTASSNSQTKESQLENSMVMREYMELNAEERVFMLSFLCDEALELSTFRKHMEQSMSLSSKTVKEAISGHKTDNPVTKALTILKKKYGSFLEPVPINKSNLELKEGVLYRCHCLEPIWSGKHHCVLCHQSYINIDKHFQNCKIWRPITRSGKNLKGKKNGKKDAHSNGASSSSSTRSAIHVCALGPLQGNMSIILEYLKIDLMDMEAAIPEEALRASRSSPERRRAWRAFTKSANTIYEMIQSTITLEDIIRGDHLQNDWWYWSSPSAAAQTSTLSALALHIYVLDSAIIYERPTLSYGDVDTEETPQSQSMRRQPDSDVPESSRARRDSKC